MKRPSELTRRQFSAVAAALAMPAVVPSSVFGRAGRVAPGDRLGLGFIGMGTMNRGHLGQFLNRQECQVLAVCDVDKSRRDAARAQVEEAYSKQERSGARDCAAYDDYRQLLGRKDIDAVVIATPDHWHAIQAIEACKAGKDVYCEKPLTLTVKEAKLLIDAARKYDRVFQTGSQQRSDKEFRTACEYVRSGLLGKLLTVFVGVGGPSKPCDLPGEEMEPGLDWDRWLGPAPERPYNSVLSPRGVHKHFPNWRAYREYSGGGMTDWGAHHFDIAQWGLGMDESGPVEIIPPEDPKEMQGLRYKYANGVEVIHGGPGVTFVGTTGVISVDRGRINSVPVKLLEEVLGEHDVHLYKSPGHHQDWLDCIKSRKRPICDVEVGARSVTVCHLGNIAYWTRKALKWDPKEWKLVGDQSAAQWLDRERRAAYQLPTV
ncbi:MAG: Gfo/Idh/MocA family oxidoreductase [Isosphaeraceae bacterium]